MNDAELLAAFPERRIARLTKNWETSYQPRNPIASDLSDCRRYQVIRIIGWQTREKPDDEGMGVIEHGQEMEPVMIRQLQLEGWEVVETQAPISIRQPISPGGPSRVILTGKIDGKLRIGGNRGELIPFDTKDTSEWTVEGIETEKDLQGTQWRRKWWRQIQSYLIGHALERGLLILGFRGKRKPVLIRLDYQAAEEILQLCAWAVEVVERFEASGITAETVDGALLAEGVDYHGDYSVCRSCPFKDRACFPPEPSRGVAAIKPQLLELVQRYLETKPAASEYEKLRKAIARETEGYRETIVGDYVLEGAVKTRNMKAKPAYVSESWGFSVRSVGERGVKEDS